MLADHPSHVTVDREMAVHHKWRSGLPHRLFILELAMGFLAFTCGALLTVTTLGMPVSTLDHSPFESFVIPGLILCFGVGGCLLLAARMTWFEHRLAPVAGFAAGCILFGWIVIESLMIHHSRLLQLGIALYAIVLTRIAWQFYQGESSSHDGDELNSRVA